MNNFKDPHHGRETKTGQALTLDLSSLKNHRMRISGRLLNLESDFWAPFKVP